MKENGNSTKYQQFREKQRQKVLDSVHVQRGEAFAPYDIEKLLDITRNSAVHMLASMADDGLLTTVKRRNDRGLTTVWYRQRGSDLARMAWRKNPDYNPLGPYWRLGGTK